MIIVEIAGHLGADPETRMTPSGQKVTNLRVATNIGRGDKEDTIWWKVTIWGSEMDNMIKHMKKGSALIAIGEMGRLDIYNDKEGRPQIGYQMTARMMKFSPFGRTDRPQGEHGQATQQVSHAYTGGHNGFGTHDHGSSAFGTGQQQAAYSAEDDAPPF
jgi:single-strand DNA-binding protein